MILNDLNPGMLIKSKSLDKDVYTYRLIEKIDRVEMKWLCCMFKYPYTNNFFNESGYPQFEEYSEAIEISKTEFMETVIKATFKAVPRLDHLNQQIINRIIAGIV